LALRIATLFLAERRHERGGLEREGVGVLRAGGLDLVDKGEQVVVEPSVRRDADDGGRLREERFRNDVPKVFAADADVGFAPAGPGIGAVAVPFAGMEDDDGSAAEGDAFAARELDRSPALAYVEKLVFPFGERPSVAPGEIVVGRVVFVRVRLAGLGQLMSRAGHIKPELALDGADGAVEELVHGAKYSIITLHCVSKS